MKKLTLDERLSDAQFKLRNGTDDDLSSAVAEVRNLLRDAMRLFDEALPKFNWGASALDANAIQILNEVPVAVRQAFFGVIEQKNGELTKEQIAFVRKAATAVRAAAIAFAKLEPPNDTTDSEAIRANRRLLRAARRYAQACGE